LGCFSLKNSATEIAAPFLAGVRLTRDSFGEVVLGFAILF
jgi:hypothetical protein